MCVHIHSDNCIFQYGFYLFIFNFFPEEKKKELKAFQFNYHKNKN